MVLFYIIKLINWGFTPDHGSSILIQAHLYHQVIQVWFQNRRSKEKRDANREELSTPIATPPTALPLQLSTTPTPLTVPASLSSSPVSIQSVTLNGKEGNP